MNWQGIIWPIVRLGKSEMRNVILVVKASHECRPFTDIACCVLSLCWVCRVSRNALGHDGCCFRYEVVIASDLVCYVFGVSVCPCCFEGLIVRIFRRIAAFVFVGNKDVYTLESRVYARIRAGEELDQFLVVEYCKYNSQIAQCIDACKRILAFQRTL